jgi:mannose-6-phosphate isomerase-like protein (cupin superfamily)
MGYYVIDPEEIEEAPDRPSKMYHISQTIGMQNLGLRFYDVAPGEQIPLAGMHYHEEQEEVFFVVAGELRIETPKREYTVKQRSFFIVEPESPHRAYNAQDADENAVVVAAGAPPVDDGHPYE